MKDIILPTNAPTELFLDKHGKFIAAYGTKKDDYVSKYSFLFLAVLVIISVTVPVLLLFERSMLSI